MSALAASSSCTHAVWPSSAAKIRAVSPSSSAAKIFALASRNICVHAVSPCHAVEKIAMRSYSFTAVTSALGTGNVEISGLKLTGTFPSVVGSLSSQRFPLVLIPQYNNMLSTRLSLAGDGMLGEGSSHANHCRYCRIDTGSGIREGVSDMDIDRE